MKQERESKKVLRASLYTHKEGETTGYGAAGCNDPVASGSLYLVIK